MLLRFAPMILSGVLIASGAQAQTNPPAAAPPPPATAATPPAAATPAAASYTPFTAPSPPVDLVATLKAAGKFTTLIKLLDAAGLTAPLSGPQNLTMFAPTDEAFAALPAGTVDGWLKPDARTALQKELLYHLINSPVLSSAVVGHAAADIPSGAGPTLHVDGSSGAMKINGADVVQTDIKASNGTLQVIDKVLMLPS